MQSQACLEQLQKKFHYYFDERATGSSYSVEIYGKPACKPSNLGNRKEKHLANGFDSSHCFCSVAVMRFTMRSSCVQF